MTVTDLDDDGEGDALAGRARRIDEPPPAPEHPLWYVECVARGEAALGSLRSRQPPPILYHYTSAAGLLGILARQCIFASDSRYVNDSQELIYGQHVVQRVLTRHIDTGRARDLARWVREGIDSVEVFVASFSTNPDVLSQWRAYAADGLGYSIGLRTGEPLRIGDDTLHFLPVIYDEKEQDELVESILVPALGKIDLANHRDEMNLKNAYCDAMQRVLAVLKNPGFKEESEWRLVVPTSWYWGPEPTVFTPSRFGITPHVELTSSSGKMPVGALYLGPKIDRVLGKNAIYELLRSHKYRCQPGEAIAPDDVVVEFSNTTYR